jgi:hypothetical protein
MSQRECAGFNWPVLVVSAGDPLSVSPEAADSTISLRYPLVLFVAIREGRKPFRSIVSIAAGDGHDASAAIESVNAGPKPHFFPRSALFATISSNVPFGSISLAVGVGHEVKSLSDVRRADARSRKTGRPAGVADSFQVILNKVEPAVSNRAFNLLTKD